jgi:hemolysin III
MSTSPLPVTQASLFDVPLGSPGRPTWRGRLHLIALCVCAPLLALLAVVVDEPRARAAVIVYGVGLCAMFAVSTAYHRWVHTLRSRAIWRRADHATIFAGIGGTCSAFALTCLSPGRAIVMLVFVWSAAIAGAAFKVVGFQRAHRYGGPMYVALGWSGMMLVPGIWRHAGAVPVALVLAGGLLYTVGAIVFGLQWPRLRPATFSFHEVWHASTIVAAGLHLGAVAIVVT